MRIADFHNDLLTSNEDKVLEIKKYKEKKYKVVTAYFRGGNSLAKALCDVNNFFNFKNSNCYFALEDIGYEQDKTEKLLQYYPVYATLTWNGENVLGYGCDYQSCGIKEKGKKMVKKLNQYHICVDCSHISRKGFYDLADLAETLICSHTAFDAVRKHKRNITDEQIKIIIEKGGIIGLCLYNDFLTEKQIGEVDCLIRQIDYFVNKFGYKSLCFGSDFYGAKNFAGGINNYNKFSKIVEKLRKIGYNKNVINDICFNNLNLFLEKVDARQKFIR